MKIIALNHYTNKAGNLTKQFFDYSGGLASSRIQLKPALVAAKSLGMNPDIWSIHTSQPEDLYKLNKADICIVGKLNSNTIKKVRDLATANMAALTHLKRLGSKILLLYSDNHLAGSGHVQDLYQDLVYFSDDIVCPTNTLKNEIENFTNGIKTPFVIEDPWSLNKYSYKKVVEKNLRMVWFGSGLNIPYLARELTKIVSITKLPVHVEISILCSEEPLRRLEKFIGKLAFDNHKFSFKYILWDHLNQPTQLEKLLAHSEIALLPSDPSDPMKYGVSHNRLVDAARCGCIPLASPMDSYLELKKISLIGNNFADMVLYAFNNKDRLQSKYESLRDPALERFSPKLNDSKWKTVLLECLKKSNHR